MAMKTFKFFKNNNLRRYTPVNVWKTHDGDLICISDMSTQHIKNVLNCIRGLGNMTIPNPYLRHSHDEWINIFELELTFRNETI